MTGFHVVTGPVAAALLRQGRPEVMAAVAAAYVAHETGRSTLGPSAFLRFPDRPDARIVALSGSLHVGPTLRVGMKWIASFPGNVARGEPRASAVVVLNDPDSGRPIACLEGAGISAARTGASAAVAAQAIIADAVPRVVSLIGTGPIARSVVDHLAAGTVVIGEVRCHDLDQSRATDLASCLDDELELPARVVDADEAWAADVVVLATNAARPHVGTERRLRPGQVVLHLSLRDLDPRLLLTTYNVVDDVDHCLQAETSPHLAERLTGSRDFIHATIGQLLLGQVEVDRDRPAVVSPFGLGVLDVTVGSWVLAQALAEGSAFSLPGFVDGPSS